MELFLTEAPSSVVFCPTKSGCFHIPKSDLYLLFSVEPSSSASALPCCDTVCDKPPENNNKIGGL